MEQFYSWLGDLNQVPGLGPEWVGLISVLASVLCGGVIGVERELRDKPAGLRTLILISVGSTIFTCVSLLLSRQKAIADPARLAAQIIPGIGFLGAGAIIRARGTVRGLTTGATIWTVAAVGVVVGAGYIAAGVVFTTLILLTLTLLHRVQRMISGACDLHAVRVVYRPEQGKTRPRLQGTLDRYAIPDKVVKDAGRDDARVLECRVCTFHRDHRGVLKELAEIGEVQAIEVD